MRRVDRELAPHFDATPPSDGLFYGSGTVRFGRVFARSDASHALATDGLVHGLAAAVLAPHRGHCIVFLTVWLGCCLYALIRGGVPERVGSVVFLVAAIASLLVEEPSGMEEKAQR